MTVIIDSGAFTAWSSGKPIDIDEYVAFCQSDACPDHFVALDVIPGEGGKKNQTITNKDILACCKQSVANYAYMVDRLPQEKLIPVFHQGDPIEFLHEYYDMGARYIGVSPNNNMPTLVKKAWLTDTVLPHMSKFPDLKTHGFGVHSFRLIDSFPWYSVDSTAWARQANTGVVFVPRYTKGKYDYARTPLLMPVAPASCNYGKLTRREMQYVRDYIDHIGLPFGEWKAPKVKKGFDIQCSEPTAIPKHLVKDAVIVEDGISVNRVLRYVANVLYLQEAVKHRFIEKIYIAAFVETGFLPYEHMIDNRLFSFVDVSKKITKAALDIQFAKGV